MAGNIFSQRSLSRLVIGCIFGMCLLTAKGCHEMHLFAVSGQVIDRSGQAVAGLQVALELRTTTLDTQTDAEGRFLLQCEFTPPEYDLGYTTATLKVSADDADEYTLDVTPTKEPPRGADDRVRVLVVLCESEAKE